MKFMRYPIISNNKKIMIDESRIISKIKDMIKNSRVMRKLFEEFEVSPEKIDDLRIRIVEIDDKYAETDADQMLLNKFMFEKGTFFDDYFFVVMHEIVHYLSRTKEQNSYFADPEEQLGFVNSIAFEIERGTDLDIIWNRIYPKVEFHFHNPRDAKQFFKNMVEKAYKLLES
jgi:hypothetical protein